jgi:lipoate-protein ligase A
VGAVPSSSIPSGACGWTWCCRKSPLWLGAAWSRALAAVGIEAELYEAGLEQTPWGRLVCFAAMGPGELLVGGRKAVGISQRRTREGARFQCIVYDRWDPSDVLDLLTLSADDRARASAELAEVAVGVGDLLPDLEDAILAELLD